MITLISMGEGGSINPARVVMVASMASAPIKRFVHQTAPDKLVNLTYGYPQRSVIIFDNGMVAITRYPAEQVTLVIGSGKEVDNDELPF